MSANGSPAPSPLVVFTDRTDLDESPARDLLERAGFSTLLLDLNKDPTVPDNARHAVAGIVGYAHITEHILRQFPHLRLLCTTSTGTDMIDADAADRQAVKVVGLKNASTHEVATHAVMLMLATIRDLLSASDVVKDGGWTGDWSTVPRATESLTLGLVGYGRIGQETARRGRPFFREIIAHDPLLSERGDIEMVAIDDLVSRADVISLHMPATAETYQMVSTPLLAKMKSGSVLVNVSRASLVDEDAVRTALNEGRLGGYAADVLEGEPPAAHHSLRNHPRALITPHVAYRSASSLQNYQIGPARTIISELGAGGSAG